MRNIKKTSLFVRLSALILALVMVVPMGASAAVQPRASAYLDSYSAYVYPAGSGLVQVWFNVQGTGYMDELSAKAGDRERLPVLAKPYRCDDMLSAIRKIVSTAPRK